MAPPFLTRHDWPPSLPLFCPYRLVSPETGRRRAGLPHPGRRRRKDLEFDLAEALKKGPVVLYFFPKAFTKGCTIEANAFAEATPRFAALGATVVGMSHDDIDTLRKFSVEECRDRFAVASDPQARTIKAYDASSLLPGMASRISYVIGQDGRITFAHEGSDPLKHVEETLKAVQSLGRPPR